MDFTDEQIERYARHIVLKEVGGAGQQRLLRAKVLVVGAGGLGCPVTLYLAAAGVGTIGVVDDDVVSLSNLQRQIAHTTARIGVAKTASAAASVAAINPDVRVIEHRARLTADNALDLIGGVRSGGRRQRQFRHPVSGQRRLLPGREDPGHGGDRAVRWPACHVQGVPGG